ncbi:MAG: hypothetical protein JWM11_1125 [Planctomycetaceae bacterium]|nr:hypothetical protein [Planctomycetaceae bacterium]
MCLQDSVVPQVPCSILMTFVKPAKPHLGWAKAMKSSEGGFIPKRWKPAAQVFQFHWIEAIVRSPG